MYRSWWLDRLFRLNAFIWGAVTVLAFLAGSVIGKNIVTGCISAVTVALASFLVHYGFERRFSDRFFGWLNEVRRIRYLCKELPFKTVELQTVEAAFARWVAMILIDPDDPDLDHCPNRDFANAIAGKLHGPHEALAFQNLRLLSGVPVVLASRNGIPLLWLERSEDRIEFMCRVPYVGCDQTYDESRFCVSRIWCDLDETDKQIVRRRQS